MKKFFFFLILLLNNHNYLLLGYVYLMCTAHLLKPWNQTGHSSHIDSHAVTAFYLTTFWKPGFAKKYGL